MKLQDIRNRQITVKENYSFLGIKWTATLFVRNVLEVKYNNEWRPVNTVKQEHHIK